MFEEEVVKIYTLFFGNSDSGKTKFTYSHELFILPKTIKSKFSKCFLSKYKYIFTKVWFVFQDKLAQVKDARAALEALREEERERKRREAEEAERLRQNQMREKLELMRKKKTEYLQYQRQLAMQRMQEQEREMMLRQEQSRQQYHQVMFPSFKGTFKNYID